MSTGSEQGVMGRSVLSAAEVTAISALRDRCNRVDGLDLKLELEARRDDADPGQVSAFLYYEDAVLVGCCTLDGRTEVEICGMVDPEERHRGIGRALLAAAKAECMRRGTRRILLICEDASAGGKAFVAAHGGHLLFAEHRMELETLVPQTPGRSSMEPVEIRVAQRSDLEPLAHAQAAIFADSVDYVRWSIERDMDDPNTVFYLALAKGLRPISSLKVIFAPPRAFIYAFGVVPEERGHGYGGLMLTQVIELLQAAGWRKVALEVEVDNAPALALYTARGFHITTTYGYYELAEP